MKILIKTSISIEIWILKITSKIKSFMNGEIQIVKATTELQAREANQRRRE